MLAALVWLVLAAPSEAAPTIRGFNFPVWWSDAYSSAGADESLRRLAATGANWIAVTPTWYAASLRDSHIRRSEATPTDESLRHAIRRARSLGLSVMLKPHLDAPGNRPRAFIRPEDSKAWFQEYRAFILHYAGLAEEEGCAMFAVGTELFLTTGLLYKGDWERIIAEVRTRYRGPLTYAANWYDAARVPFWRSLDFIGVDAYYPVPGSDRAAMRRGWAVYRGALGALSKIHGKPLLVTEVGLSSQKGANWRPWDYGDFGELDLQVQADYLGAFLDAFSREGWFAGYLLWAWDVDPGAGGLRDKSMAVQGKPALEVLKEAFGSASPGAPRAELERAFGRATETAAGVASALPR